jgi:hypothetical protein
MRDIVERLDALDELYREDCRVPYEEANDAVKAAKVTIQLLRGDIAIRDAEITVLQTELSHATAKIREAHGRPGFDCPCRYCRSPRAPRVVPDNAGRMYLIPSERDDEWDEWCDSGSADVPSWTKPLSENKSI